MSEPTLLVRGATVITMDPATGILPRGDVLVRGDTIAAVGPGLDPAGAEIVDAAGMIVMPGMVDGHKHTWQTIFRDVSGDHTLIGFFSQINPATSPLMTPDDVYASNLLGMVDALDAGVTTILDFCHITLTPEHTRAALRGVRDSGARAWFAHGGPQARWAEALEHPRDLADLQREEFRGGDEIVRLAMAARGPVFAPFDVAKREIQYGRELGLPISLHTDLPGFGHDEILRLDEAGLLGPDMTFLHASTATDREVDVALSRGAHFVDSSPLDVLMGIGPAVSGKLRAHGIVPGISADSCIANPADLFWVMRGVVLMERARKFGESFAADQEPVESHLTAHDLLEMATMGGANAVWMGDRIGSLTGGKLADLVILRPGPNMRPVNDPEAAVVYAADRSNVDSVMVNGRFVKRGGRMLSVDADAVAALADEARDRVYERAAANGYVPAWRAPNAAIGA